MEQSKIENLLKEKSMNLFSNEWYQNTSSEICNLFKFDKNIGYVYFLRSEKSSYVKIGKSKDIDKRVKQLECNVGKINILGFIYSEDYDLIEKSLHSTFKDFRKYGEWFDLSFNDVKDIITKHKGQILNTDISKVSISDGVFDIKSVNTNLQTEIFFNKCDEFLEFNKSYTNDELQDIFKEFNYSKKLITMYLKQWSVLRNKFYSQKNTNSKRLITFVN
jgi:hypothetical protein